MNKEQTRARIEEIGIIPAIRVSAPQDALFAAEAVSESGIPVVEVTMTVPGATEVIAELKKTYPELIVGAGTIFDVETARRCLGVGADFLTSPGLDLEMLEFALRKEAVVFPGALTPSDIMAARKAGPDFIKVFPCSVMGGPSYIQTLRRPFPDVRFIASGGVNQHTIGEFFIAGAVAVGIGRELIAPAAIERRERGWIRELARRYVRSIKEARSRLPPRKGGTG